MADQKSLDWKTKPSSADIAGAPEGGVDDVDERSQRDARGVPWADGFVSSGGTHIPLFIPRARKSHPSSEFWRRIILE